MNTFYFWFAYLGPMVIKYLLWIATQNWNPILSNAIRAQLKSKCLLSVEVKNSTTKRVIIVFIHYIKKLMF